MTDRYVDSTTGSNLDNGTTPALAWATVEYALESGSLAAGYDVWVRRLHSEIPTTDIAPAYTGAIGTPIQIIGWPRTTVTGTATFTNGSTSVTSVSITADREKHQGRYIKCDADGGQYLITRVVDANTVTIDREYASTTATTSAFTIQADEDYSARPAAGTSAGWDADAHDLPVIDFNDGAYNLYNNSRAYMVFKNLEVKDSSDTYGIVYLRQARLNSIIGCLIKQSASNTMLFNSYNVSVYLARTIFEGSGAGSSQNGAVLTSFSTMKDCAIYNCGGYGLSPANPLLENVNIGVEQANGGTEIYLISENCVHGRDVKLGGTNGDVTFAGSYYRRGCGVRIENYGKVLGAHKEWYHGGTIEKAAVTGETPNKKLSDNVIKISPTTSGIEAIEDWAIEVFCHEFDVDTTTRTWKYWVYNDAMGTLNDTTATDNIWLKLEYVSKYDDTSEYVIADAYSTEIDILNAADANDWDYLQVSSITPAVASKVRIRCYVSDYSAAGHIYIDPQVVTS